MRGLVLTAVMLILTTTNAWSQETVSTASASDSHPPGSQTAAPPLVDRVTDEDRGPVGPVNPGPCGPRGSNDQAPGADMAAHGAVMVGVGTRGYREAAGWVCKPLTGGGAIAVGIDDSQQSRGRAR
jgi:hypothetical protein